MPKNNTFEGARSRDQNDAPKRERKVLKKIFQDRDIEPKKREESIRQRKIDRKEANQEMERGVSDFSFGPDTWKKWGKLFGNIENTLRKGISNLVNAAESFMGTGYVMGGQGKGGIDCSGLVVEAMRKAGRPIPDMTAADMKARTPKISPNQARPGDLLVWDDGGHVEMIKNVTSDGQIITVGSVGGSGVGVHTYSLGGNKSVHRNTLA
jgi:cell wall-associated NlpC family hydrolase